MKVLKILLVLGSMLVAFSAQTQNLEEVLTKEFVQNFFTDFKKAKPFDIHGGLSAGMRFYNSNASNNRQSPWLWNLSGNTTVSIYKLKIPFSAFVTTQSAQINTPSASGFKESFEKRFTRIGASPYYKWAKIHVGHRTMNFSSFTLAKHTFLGAGTELTPGRLRLAAMYGKLPQTAPRNLSLTNINQEAFNRMGWGTKIGYGSQKSFIDFIVFNARDDLSSQSLLNQDTLNKFPEENLVIGLNGKAQLTKRIKIYGEVASSAITKNANDPEIEGSQFPHPGFLLNNRTSTSFKKAVNAGVTFQVSRFNIGLDYRRIDPGYKSLGAYFFQDDFENYTANARWSMLKQKLNIVLNGGVQKNNLDNLKDQQIRRTIGSVAMSYFIEDLTFNVNYSNFSNDLSYVLNPDLDSLNAVVVTQSTGAMVTWRKSMDSQKSHSLTLGGNLQRVNDEILDPSRSATSNMKTANLNYAYSTGPSKWKYKAQVNFNQNELTGRKINRVGVGGGISKIMLDDALSISYDLNYFDSNGESFDLSTLNNRLNIKYKVTKSQSFDFTLQMLNRNRKGGNNPLKTNEQIGNVRYGYRF